MTRILSIDIGSTNFGWSRWSADRGFYDFGLLNLKTVKGKDLPGENAHAVQERVSLTQISSWWRGK